MSRRTFGRSNWLVTLATSRSRPMKVVSAAGKLWRRWAADGSYSWSGEASDRGQLSAGRLEESAAVVGSNRKVLRQSLGQLPGRPALVCLDLAIVIAEQPTS